MQTKTCKSFGSKLLRGIGYGLAGNFMAAIMAFSLGIFRASTELMLIATLFALAIFLSLVGLPAYKDSLALAEKSHTPQGANRRDLLEWFAVGAVVWLLMSVPSALHLGGLITDGVLRLLSGATAPLGWLLIEFIDIHGNPVTELTEADFFRLLPWVGWLYIALYSLSIPACLLGSVMGTRYAKKK
ncbi:MAG: hypothetical protein FWD35_05295 [Oscillospiraceae bacterium]|nr:hypothetical protein [Oscillospiraceae bacterium]